MSCDYIDMPENCEATQLRSLNRMVCSLSIGDFRQDTLVMVLYCILPVLSFPVTLISVRSLRWSVALHWILAPAYLAVYSLLNWRTCAELGYCESVLATVLVTTTTRRVRGFFWSRSSISCC